MTVCEVDGYETDGLVMNHRLNLKNLKNTYVYVCSRFAFSRKAGGPFDSSYKIQSTYV